MPSCPTIIRQRKQMEGLLWRFGCCGTTSHVFFCLAAARDMLFQRPFLPKRPCLRNCLMELYLSNNVIEDLVVTLVSFQGKTTAVCSWDLKWRWDFQLSISQICRIADCISGIFAGSIGLHSFPAEWVLFGAESIHLLKIGFDTFTQGIHLQMPPIWALRGSCFLETSLLEHSNTWNILELFGLKGVEISVPRSAAVWMEFDIVITNSHSCVCMQNTYKIRELSNSASKAQLLHVITSFCYLCRLVD